MERPAASPSDDQVQGKPASDGLSGTSSEEGDGDSGFPDDAFDLACPGCSSDLTGDSNFLAYRVCGNCRRHFSIPARERIALIVDPASFAELTSDGEARTFENPMPGMRSMPDHHDLRVIGDSIVTGTAWIDGVQTVVVSLDDHLVGPSIGALMTEKIIAGFELAHIERSPLVIICAGGTALTRPGPLSAVQAGRLAASAARLHMDGVPMIAILTHPTSGWIFRALACQCDLVLAEPGSRIGMHPGDNLPDHQSASAESLMAGGWVDDVIDRTELHGRLSTLLNVLAIRGFVRPGTQLPSADSSGPASWQALARLDDPDRPDGAFYLSSLVSSLTPLRGDRVAGDDPGTICGLGRFDSVTIAIVVLNHPHASDAKRSEAIAARKIMRLVKLAGRLELSVLILIDGEDRTAPMMPTTIESAQAVASLSGILAMLPVPVTSVAIGEVSGALATALMSVDRQFMQDHAVLTSGLATSSSPSRGFGSLHTPADLPERVGILTARECLRLGLIDGVIGEPGAGSQADPHGAAAAVRSTVQHAMAELAGAGQRRLRETRHQ